jgi:sugar phosphate isomerase/epimerase
MALPPHPANTLPAGLCVFGLTYACGMTWSGTAKANTKALTGRQVIERAHWDGLSHVEMPAAMLGDLSREGLKETRAFAETRGIRFIVPSGNVLSGKLEQDLLTAAALGAPAVRCTLSSVLCGDRRGFPGGWKEHLKACRAELEKRVAEAERLKVAIAIENHQDADSADLLDLCGHFESRYLGVTLDMGNPLAVMEHPVRFAERLAKYLRHAHMKDYRIYHAPNGFRLVRCAMGEGVIPFPELFKVLDAQEFPITRSIEMAALQARQIPFLERAWWDEYAPRDVRDALPALDATWPHLRPLDEEYRTPFERDANGPALLAYEWGQHEKTVAYLRDHVK